MKELIELLFHNYYYFEPTSLKIDWYSAKTFLTGAFWLSGFSAFIFAFIQGGIAQRKEEKFCLNIGIIAVQTLIFFVVSVMLAAFFPFAVCFLILFILLSFTFKGGTKTQQIRIKRREKKEKTKLELEKEIFRLKKQLGPDYIDPDDVEKY